MFEERKPFNLHPTRSSPKWIDRGSSNAIHKNVCNENEGNKKNQLDNEKEETRNQLRNTPKCYTVCVCVCVFGIRYMNAKTT